MAFLFSATKTGFNTQPRGGGCFESICIKQAIFEFQHTAARRRLQAGNIASLQQKRFQHTAARRRLRTNATITRQAFEVSTHSRAEAAAAPVGRTFRKIKSFNTQPRGGGCVVNVRSPINTSVSTHSRAEAAAFSEQHYIGGIFVSTHSRAEAAALYIKKQEKSAY